MEGKAQGVGKERESNADLTQVRPLDAKGLNPPAIIQYRTIGSTSVCGQFKAIDVPKANGK